MSTEAQTRPAASRGRGGGRGGRGGQSRGGARQQTRANGDKFDSLDAIEDEGEIGELKKLYGAKTALIKEMFSDWSEVDILFVLQETDGDENLAVTRIADGQASQWGEVSKTKKDRSKSKAPKDITFTTTTGETTPGYNRPSRGGRDGGRDGGRGRGRATERGGRSTRGRAVSAGANGTHNDKSNDLSVPTEESPAWDNAKADETPAWPSATTEAPAAPKSTAPSTTAAPAPSKPAVSTWASMLRQSTAPKPAPVKPKAAPAPPPAETIEPLPAAAEEPAAEEPEPVEEPLKEPVKEDPAPEPVATVVPEVALPPSQDQLTETNLEQITDISHPPETETARSEAADSWDPRTAALSATATPLSASQQQHQNAQSSRAATSGFAATAIKATERAATRTPSYGRRLLDQEEAVRMPTNREVDRATVQFGALNFSGEEDIDGDREEPETRAQPPVDSPVSHPRTSLPVAQPAAVPDSFAAQKPVAAPAAATPTAPAVPSAIAPQQPAAMAQAAPQQPPISQPSQPHQGFGRFGQDQHSFGQKPYDAFGQPNMTNPPATTQNQYDGFQGQAPAQTQPLTQAPAPAAAPAAAMSSAPNDYSSFYTADPSSRAPYSGYYGNNFGQQQASQGHQDGPQRSLGAYNTSQADPLSQYPQSGAQAQASSRFGAGSALDSQNSGNNTPQPTAQNQQQAGQNTQSQAQQAQHQYPYGGQHPYQYSPYYAAYMNQQYNSAYGQGGYGSGPYGSKGGVYGQPTQYGMNPPYDHASTGASGFGQSSLHRNDSGLGSGLDYGRASGQSANQQGLGSGGFGGGVHDNFGRGSTYQSQAGQGFNNPSQQTANAPSGNDDLKPFGEKAGSGPSPSISGARPMSAANNAQSQQGLPPSQSGQQGAAGMGGYGGYPGHLQQQGHHIGQTGAGGFGAGAGQQGHGNNPYGAYGNQGFGGSYYGAQPRGWGNNYH
ncbi:hypothetical protein MCOR02_005358 [Pyricularia oryzae]|uniref:RNA polymerase II degradation factor 1 n=4 Tax=Pyricularia oryzae TaxID=318829 RepID=G4NEF1_PYRO7|nr:uncharacterized protein MGG_00124 [Pyricularia oryzae 70-15]ELQ43939.1 hypothetical protein OOU_Y34scaffold00119g2 [Pyricularia oryzae Y34]KAH9433304.1 hypothetical protein MCOR02_005358 [Pyricularia oryzae]EHA49428.1 hypothetical protein MGG_00124 [Pyricularia oryzae 70-15]KAI6284044.1 hypothetical protein MCOR26_002172 [Pyricularia oryzae]KAI6326793.1 hypothetical protein MCOR30_006406 [Pyricularia oryzae]